MFGGPLAAVLVVERPISRLNQPLPALALVAVESMGGFEDAVISRRGSNRLWGCAQCMECAVLCEDMQYATRTAAHEVVSTANMGKQNCPTTNGG